MKVNGSCHCGAVTYEAEIDPERVQICHCTDCQTLSGSAFRTVAPTEEGTFRLLSGELKVYVKTADSGNLRQQSFCPECGTPIYAAPEGVGDRLAMLRVGTIRERQQLAPKRQIWARSALGWLVDLTGLPKIATGPK